MHDLPPVDKPLLRACASGADLDIEAFIVDAEDQIEAAARDLCRRNSMWDFYEDVRSIVTIKAIELAKSIPADPHQATTGHTLSSMLARRAGSEVRSFAASSTAAASGKGVVNAARRSHGIAKTESEISQQWGRTPSETELVIAHNEKIRARRKDPRKQGELVSSDDVGAHRRMTGSPLHATSADSPEEATSTARLDRAGVTTGIDGTPDGDADSVITKWEGKKFRAAIVEAAHGKDPDLGRTATVWVDYVSQHTNRGTIATVSQHLQISRTETKRRIGLIRDLAKDVLTESFGISGDDL